MKRQGTQAVDITVAAQKGRKGKRVTMPPGEAKKQKIPCRLKLGAGSPRQEQVPAHASITWCPR